MRSQIFEALHRFTTDIAFEPNVSMRVHVLLEIGLVGETPLTYVAAEWTLAPMLDDYVGIQSGGSIEFFVALIAGKGLGARMAVDEVALQPFDPLELLLAQAACMQDLVKSLARLNMLLLVKVDAVGRSETGIAQCALEWLFAPMHSPMFGQIRSAVETFLTIRTRERPLHLSASLCVRCGQCFIAGGRFSTVRRSQIVG